MPAWGQINEIDISAPSDFSEGIEVVGGYNTTLFGTKRRYIKAAKKIWKLRYSYMTTDEYDAIYAEFEREIPSGLQVSNPNTTFTIYDARNHVNQEAVHMDVGERNFVPGTDLLSDIDITFIQV
jgi:hypothetical protein